MVEVDWGLVVPSHMQLSVYIMMLISIVGHQHAYKQRWLHVAG